MLSQKAKDRIPFKLLLLILLFFFMYTLLMMYKLGTYSEKLEKEFKTQKIEGKSINEAIKILGNPAKIEHETPWIKDKDFNLKVVGSYFRLTYYTGNQLLNAIGYFPGGGTRIFADDNSKVTGFKTYLY